MPTLNILSIFTVWFGWIDGILRLISNSKVGMAHLSAIGVRRLRTLYDLGDPIALAPLTVLLGKNSAGKSTFARLLPLLRQSAERKKRGPILWFDELVDFGTLGQSVTRGETDLEIVLQFDEVTASKAMGRNMFWGEGSAPNALQIDRAVVSMTLGEESSTGATFAKEVRIDVSGTSIQLCMKSARELESLTVGSRRVGLQEEKTRISVDQGSLFPKLRFLERRKVGDAEIWIASRNPWRSAVSDFILMRVHGRTSRGTTAQIAAQLPVATPKVVSEAAQRIAGPGSWDSLKITLTAKAPITSALIESLLLANIDLLMDRLDEIASSAAMGVRYLKPLRATAQRYYRRADLAVSEIDPEGRNLAIFLDSLSDTQLANFRKWIKRNLDIDVEPKREGAQLVLMARAPNDSGASNVADMGFGISQILPIAAQLWASSNAAKLPFSPTSFVVVEQPELHLHPAFQAKLGDLFAGIASPIEQATGPGRRILPPRIVIETHSQHLVNRLGLLVEQGRLAPSDVSIVLFEPNSDRVGTSKIRIASFDKEGVLENWPFGFFEPDY